MTTLLRAWAAADAPALVDAVASTPDLATQLPVSRLASADDARAFIGGSLRAGPARRVWAVVDDGVPIGSIALTHIDRRHDTAWVSYWLASAARGRGLATRALAAASDWGFAHAGLFRLELGHRVNNPASCGVATRAGFAREGLERAKLRYGEERFDVELHARLATDPAPDVAPLPRA
ncbi:GNAT family N-acetyltransferase [Microbacterium sp. zg.Y625]|uniref:GNAT family N-acetyltransferase n=1 Tax=Microbacterium jiangjiandongii TaxID=3049071 RepID=UPI00214BAE07|nr:MULTISPECIES: GNAT family protein [unclassified Microbacterium]MCR2791884.1 GNAT family N-acetyltransferase [Microbacterium sp. zg.Y625]MCR2815291.1 GNAT family N-acetyltransferase [Microbacterium sp. zg.Y843]WIM24698.1 GNAT family protein [Microbacterium sp. zg-Y625]